MTHSVVEMVLGSAVATSGTFSVDYPAGKSKGDFINGSDHRLVALQADHRVGKGFTIAFGDTAATVTWLGTTTIPASSRVWVQLDESGRDYRDEKLINKAVQANPVLVTLGSPDTADSDGVVASQACTAASGLATGINGAYSNDANDKATLDVPRAIVAAWTGTAVLTVTGKDEYGNTLIESSASGTSLTGKKAFSEITDVSTSADITGLTVGTSDVLGLPFYLRDADTIIAEYENSVKLSGGESRVFVPYEIEETELLAGTSEFVIAPIAGEITDFRAVTQKTVGTGGTLTLELATVAVTGASITVADSASPGDLDVSTAITGANTVAAGDDIEIVPASAFATSGEVNGYIEITGPAVTMGTYVVGSQAAGSATSGDVRGTLTPSTACDGVTSFSIVAFVDDPNYLGAPQYAG